MPVPQSIVAICNLALSRIGVLQQITSLDDGTPAALACTQAYDQCRQELVHEFPWGWASEYAILTQLSTTGTRANAEWLYAYAYPTDCLFIRRLMPTPIDAPVSPGVQPSPTWDRSDTNAYPVPFEIGYWNGNQECIFTDLANATAKYTRDQGDTTVFAPEFTNILCWRLAVELAYPLANSEERRQTAQRNYDRERISGAAHTLNESQNSKPFDVYNTQSLRGRFCPQGM